MNNVVVFLGIEKKIVGVWGWFLIQGLSDDEFSSDIPGMFYTCFICTKKALAIVIKGLGLILFYNIVRYIVVQVVLQQ